MSPTNVTKNKRKALDVSTQEIVGVDLEQLYTHLSSVYQCLLMSNIDAICAAGEEIAERPWYKRIHAFLELPSLSTTAGVNEVSNRVVSLIDFYGYFQLDLSVVSTMSWLECILYFLRHVVVPIQKFVQSFTDWESEERQKLFGTFFDAFRHIHCQLVTMKLSWKSPQPLEASLCTTEAIGIPACFYQVKTLPSRFVALYDKTKCRQGGNAMHIDGAALPLVDEDSPKRLKSADGVSCSDEVPKEQPKEVASSSTSTDTDMVKKPATDALSDHELYQKLLHKIKASSYADLNEDECCVVVETFGHLIDVCQDIAGLEVAPKQFNARCKEFIKNLSENLPETSPYNITSKTFATQYLSDVLSFCKTSNNDVFASFKERYERYVVFLGSLLEQLKKLKNTSVVDVEEAVAAVEPVVDVNVDEPVVPPQVIDDVKKKSRKSKKTDDGLRSSSFDLNAEVINLLKSLQLQYSSTADVKSVVVQHVQSLQARVQELETEVDSMKQKLAEQSKVVEDESESVVENEERAAVTNDVHSVDDKVIRDRLRLVLEKSKKLHQLSEATFDLSKSNVTASSKSSGTSVKGLIQQLKSIHNGKAFPSTIDKAVSFSSSLSALGEKTDPKALYTKTKKYLQQSKSLAE